MSALFQTIASDLPVYPSAVAYVAVRAWLTGAPDATTDYALDFSRIDFALQSVGDDRMSVTIPFSIDAIDAVSARPNGDLLLEMRPTYDDGAVGQWFDRVRVDYETLTSSRSHSSASITLVGAASVDYWGAASFTLDVVSRESIISGGLREWQTKLSVNIKPGDAATWAGTPITVGKVIGTLSDTAAAQTITESG